MRVLQLSADRSKRGVLHTGTQAFQRQEAYAEQFSHLDIIAFSLRSDGAQDIDAGALHIFPTNSVSRLLWGWDALRAARRLPKPDVISVQDPFEAGFLAWLLSRRLAVPLHVQVHTDFLSPEYARHSLLNRLRVPVARFVLRRAARVRVVSARIQASLIHAGISTPITILPIFVDVAHELRAPEPALVARFAHFSKRLLVVARLEPEKNIALAISAFAASAPPSACLIIVGDGSERRMLEALAQEQSVAARIFFEGGHDAAPYYALVDIVLVPSTYEGYGLVIIEALARGVPVLATDVGIAREAGALIATEENFTSALAAWFENGPREASLKNYLYKDFHEYVAAYYADVAACASA